MAWSLNLLHAIFLFQFINLAIKYLSIVTIEKTQLLNNIFITKKSRIVKEQLFVKMKT